MKPFVHIIAISPVIVAFSIPAIAHAEPLRSTIVMNEMFRQCDYSNGTVIRLLASRECPVLPELSSLARQELKSNPPTNDATLQSAKTFIAKPSTIDVTLPKNPDASEVDPVLEKAISRCTMIGFKKYSPQYRTCVTDQIEILSR